MLHLYVSYLLVKRLDDPLGVLKSVSKHLSFFFVAVDTDLEDSDVVLEPGDCLRKAFLFDFEIFGVLLLSLSGGKTIKC